MKVFVFMNLTLDGVMQGPTGTAYASSVIEVNSS
jgi:hypothetical protein